MHAPMSAKAMMTLNIFFYLKFDVRLSYKNLSKLRLKNNTRSLKDIHSVINCIFFFVKLNFVCLLIAFANV